MSLKSRFPVYINQGVYNVNGVATDLLEGFVNQYKDNYSEDMTDEWYQFLDHDVNITSESSKMGIVFAFGFDEAVQLAKDEGWDIPCKNVLSLLYHVIMDHIVRTELCAEESLEDKVRTKKMSQQSIECSCGGHYTLPNKSKHIKTKKHQKYQNEKDKDAEVEDTSRGATSKFYCDIHEDELLVHDGDGSYWCSECGDFYD